MHEPDTAESLRGERSASPADSHAEFLLAALGVALLFGDEPLDD